MQLRRHLTGFQRVLTLGLMALMLLAGVERGVIGASIDAGAVGFIGPICHAAGAGGAPGSPGAPGSHDCCDECALAAAALVPSAPQMSEPARLARPVVHGTLVAGFISGSPWTPRQSQGPPVA